MANFKRKHRKKFTYVWCCWNERSHITSSNIDYKTPVRERRKLGVAWRYRDAYKQEYIGPVT